MAGNQYWFAPLSPPRCRPRCTAPISGVTFECSATALGHPGQRRCLEGADAGGQRWRQLPLRCHSSRTDGHDAPAAHLGAVGVTAVGDSSSSGDKGERSREGTNPGCVGWQLPPALALKMLSEHHGKMSLDSAGAQPAPAQHPPPPSPRPCPPGTASPAPAGIWEPVKSGTSWAPSNRPGRAAPALPLGCWGLWPQKRCADPPPALLGSVKPKCLGTGQ